MFPKWIGQTLLIYWRWPCPTAMRLEDKFNTESSTLPRKVDDIVSLAGDAESSDEEEEEDVDAALIGLVSPTFEGAFPDPEVFTSFARRSAARIECAALYNSTEVPGVWVAHDGLEVQLFKAPRDIYNRLKAVPVLLAQFDS